MLVPPPPSPEEGEVRSGGGGDLYIYSVLFVYTQLESRGRSERREVLPVRVCMPRVVSRL